MSTVLVLVLMLSLGLYTGYIRLNSTGDAGFPQNIRQAGECFFGNYQALVDSFKANISNNKFRLELLKKNHDGQSRLKNQTYLMNDKNIQKETNILNDSNRALNKQITEMEGKCLYFPKWD